MSNSLLTLAQRVTWSLCGDGVRAVRPAEMAVLMILANDARDAAGGTTALSEAEISRRSRLAPRSIRRILGDLVVGGHISRARHAGGRSAATTVVHPLADLQPPRTQSPGTPDSESGHPGLRVRAPRTQSPPLLTILPINGETSAGARADDPVGRKGDGPTQTPNTLTPPTPPPVWDRVFDAWDAMAAAAGLPGPAARGTAQRAGILEQVTRHGLPMVLAAIAAVPSKDFLVGRKRRGQADAALQGDFLAHFDWVFEVGWRAKPVFAKLLSGVYGMPPVRVADGSSRPQPPPRAIEAGPVGALRATLAARLGATKITAWIDPLEFAVDGDELIVTAPSGFHAERVDADFGAAIRAGAAAAFGRGLHPRFVVARPERAPVRAAAASP